MLTWDEFAKAAPELADFGTKRMAGRVMYLGTIRKDGCPRVHPFTPFVSAGRLFAFMEPTSPKGHDLRRDGRYAIHSLMRETNGSDGEFLISGVARPVDDPALRSVAAAGSPYKPEERYVCFEFLIGECRTTKYEDGQPHYERWKDSTSNS